MNQSGKTQGTSGGKIIDLNSARNVMNHKRSAEGAEAPAETFDRQSVLRRLQEAKTLFSLLSLCTRSPYVQCDAETFDDEIFLFFDEETAKNEANRLKERREPAGVIRIEEQQKLPFFSSLFPMGINAFCVKEGEEALHLQLEELVKRKLPEKAPEGQVRVENPSLTLTALYYAQETRRPKPEGEASEEEKKAEDAKLQELQEEMLADLSRGTFIMAVERESKNTPLLKVGDDLFHPIFTDIEEFKKFDREQKFLAAVVASKDLPRHMAQNARGVVLNPLGVNLMLNLGRASRPEGGMAVQAGKAAANGAQSSAADTVSSMNSTKDAQNGMGDVQNSTADAKSGTADSADSAKQ